MDYSQSRYDNIQSSNSNTNQAFNNNTYNSNNFSNSNNVNSLPNNNRTMSNITNKNDFSSSHYSQNNNLFQTGLHDNYYKSNLYNTSNLNTSNSFDDPNKEVRTAFKQSIASLGDIYKEESPPKNDYKSKDGRKVVDLNFALNLSIKKKQLDEMKNKLKEQEELVKQRRIEENPVLFSPKKNAFSHSVYLDDLPDPQYKVDIEYKINSKSKPTRKFSHVVAGKINPVKSMYSIKPVREQLVKEHQESIKDLVVYSHKVNINEVENFVDPIKRAAHMRSTRLNNYRTTNNFNSNINNNNQSFSNTHNVVTINLPQNHKNKSMSNTKYTNTKNNSSPTKFKSGKHRQLIKDSENLYKSTKLFFDNAEQKLPQSKKFGAMVNQLESVVSNLEKLKTKYNKDQNITNPNNNTQNSMSRSKSKKFLDTNSKATVSPSKYERKNKNILQCDIDDNLRKKVEEKLEILHVELRHIFDNLNEMNKSTMQEDLRQSFEQQHDNNVEVLKRKANYLLHIYNVLNKKLDQSGNAKIVTMNDFSKDFKFTNSNALNSMMISNNKSNITNSGNIDRALNKTDADILNSNTYENKLQHNQNTNNIGIEENMNNTQNSKNFENNYNNTNNEVNYNNNSLDYNKYKLTQVKSNNSTQYNSNNYVQSTNNNNFTSNSNFNNTSNNNNMSYNNENQRYHDDIKNNNISNNLNNTNNNFNQSGTLNNFYNTNNSNPQNPNRNNNNYNNYNDYDQNLVNYENTNSNYTTTNKGFPTNIGNSTSIPIIDNKFFIKSELGTVSVDKSSNIGNTNLSNSAYQSQNEKFIPGYTGFSSSNNCNTNNYYNFEGKTNTGGFKNYSQSIKPEDSNSMSIGNYYNHFNNTNNTNNPNNNIGNQYNEDIQDNKFNQTGNSKFNQTNSYNPNQTQNFNKTNYSNYNNEYNEHNDYNDSKFRSGSQGFFNPNSVNNFNQTSQMSHTNQTRNYNELDNLNNLNKSDINTGYYNNQNTGAFNYTNNNLSSTAKPTSQSNTRTVKFFDPNNNNNISNTNMNNINSQSGQLYKYPLDITDKPFAKINTKNVVRDELYTAYDIELPVDYYYNLSKSNEPKKEEDWYLRKHHTESSIHNRKALPDDLLNTKYISYYKPDDKEVQKDKLYMINEVIDNIDCQIDKLKQEFDMKMLKDKDMKRKLEEFEKSKLSLSSKYKEGDYEMKFKELSIKCKFCLLSF